jgi:hypothetical protein
VRPFIQIFFWGYTPEPSQKEERKEGREGIQIAIIQFQMSVIPHKLDTSAIEFQIALSHLQISLTELKMSKIHFQTSVIQL